MAWWNDFSRRKPARLRDDGFAATVPSEPASIGAAAGSRLEVCPPSSFDSTFAPTRSGLTSLLPRLGTVRQWLQSGWPAAAPNKLAAPSRPAADRLDEARRAFAAAIGDIVGAEAAQLAQRARSAHSLLELWHLRSALFTLVSIGHCEAIAHRRLAELNQHFPIRTQGLLRRADASGRSSGSGQNARR